MRYVQKTIIWDCALAVALLVPSLAMAQNTSTLTATATATSLSGNPDLGCLPCSTVDPFATFPDTSSPIFAGGPIQSLLPAIIANGLPVDNQFGAGIPSGSSDFPISVSTPFAMGPFITGTNQFSAVPDSSGATDHRVTMTMSQVTPGGNFSGSDQQFDILFSVQSMTDPDGNLVGGATGVFTQILDGVLTNGTIQFDETNGFSGTNLHP